MGGLNYLCKKRIEMIYSMTGYGKSLREFSNKKISVEIKTLNSKQTDIFARIPFIYKEKEIGIRSQLSKKLERGKIDFTIHVESIAKDISSKIDFNVVSQYHKEISEVAEKLQINVPADWFNSLLRLPDVMKQEIQELDEKEWIIVEESIKEAIDEVITFRKQEGKMLEGVLMEKIENIGRLLINIEPFESERIEKVKSRITESLSAFDNIDVDNNRFEQEMIYYIEKLDVNEEKTRLANHLDYFIDTMNDKKSQGKKLGFISQEIGREINTLGSKSNHSEMQRIVVQMKDELEQVKEQILNVL